MKALSIRAPWWWYILHGGKGIENRNWATGFRGTVLLHASKWFVERSVFEDMEVARGISGPIQLPDEYADLKVFGGCIVGQVDIVDCVTNSKSPWFFGPYGFALANPIAYEYPVECKGALGFFTPPTDVLAELRKRGSIR